MEEEQVWSEIVKRAMARTLRIIAIHRGEIPITEYTQEDFDRMLRAAASLAEPDDQEPDTHPEDDEE